MVIKNSSQLSPVVEGGIDYSNGYVSLVEIITQPEGSHGNIRKIRTVAVYDEKFGFHIDCVYLLSDYSQIINPQGVSKGRFNVAVKPCPMESWVDFWPASSIIKSSLCSELITVYLSRLSGPLV
jgi:hypothetical protein